MYIYISEEILKDSRLSGDEKIVLSFIKLLTDKGKSFFGGANWLTNNFGMQTSATVLLELLNKGFVRETAMGLVFDGIDHKEDVGSFAIKVKEHDEIQSEIAHWEAKGYELVKETEDKLIYSNRLNTAIVRKYK